MKIKILKRLLVVVLAVFFVAAAVLYKNARAYQQVVRQNEVQR